MKKLLCLLFSLCLAAPCAALADRTCVTVLAAASLTDVMEEIIAMYEQENPGVQIVASYAGSGSLQIQIEQGAPADLFISAGQKQMDALERQGLLAEGTRLNLLENRVVLIVPHGRAAPDSFQAIAAAPMIAIGDPDSVPIGQYAMEIFSYYNLAESLAADPMKLIRAKDVREVLTYVSTGNVDAGVVYETDAMLESDGVTIMARAPEESHSPVVYPAAVINNAPEKEAAIAFLRYLAQEKAAALFLSYGFTALQGPDAPGTVKE